MSESMRTHLQLICSSGECGLIRGFVSLTIAPGGVGKTALLVLDIGEDKTKYILFITTLQQRRTTGAGYIPATTLLATRKLGESSAKYLHFAA